MDNKYKIIFVDIDWTILDHHKHDWDYESIDVLKMDIEGFETKVLAASRDFLAAAPHVKVACCTYHKAADAQTLASLFDELGYHHEFSDGWMLFKMADEDTIDPPYFRHGVLRAMKQ